MAAGYIPLPGYNPGGPLNFEPVNNALMNYGNVRARNQALEQERQNQNALMQRYQSSDARAQQQLDMQRQEFAFKQQDRPLDQEFRRAQIAQSQAQAKALLQKNALEEAIAGMFKEQPQAGGNALSPQPQPPQFQPQSFQGGQPQQGLQQASNALMPQQPFTPNVQTVADEEPTTQDEAPSAPGPELSQGAVYGLPGDEMVSTPMGQMSREMARRRAMGLAAAGKGEAGKMLMDAAAGRGQMSKTAGAANDKEELANTNAIGRLEQITKSYNPDFLNVPNRVKLWGNDLAAKFTTLPAKDQQDLQGYAKFRADSFAHANKVLKDMAGTAVTDQEMRRQLQVLPNPGTGVFDGDSPPVYAAKLKTSIESAKMAIARSRYLRGQGFRGKPWEAGVEIEDMRGIINKRGAEIEQQLKQQNPTIDKQSLDMTVHQNLKQEFGI